MHFGCHVALIVTFCVASVGEHSCLDISCVCLVQERIDECKGALTIANVAFGAKRAEPKDVDTYGFKKEPKDFNVYWDVRKGLIPIVGGARETGPLLLFDVLQLLSHCNMLTWCTIQNLRNKQWSFSCIADPD